MYPPPPLSYWRLAGLGPGFVNCSNLVFAPLLERRSVHEGHPSTASAWVLLRQTVGHIQTPTWAMHEFRGEQTDLLLCPCQSAVAGAAACLTWACPTRAKGPLWAAPTTRLLLLLASAGSEPRYRRLGGAAEACGDEPMGPVGPREKGVVRVSGHQRLMVTLGVT